MAVRTNEAKLHIDEGLSISVADDGPHAGNCRDCALSALLVLIQVADDGPHAGNCSSKVELHAPCHRFSAIGG